MFGGYVSRPIIFNQILSCADTGIHTHGSALDTTHTSEEERRAVSGLDVEGRSGTGTTIRPLGTPPRLGTTRHSMLLGCLGLSVLLPATRGLGLGAQSLLPVLLLLSG
jgi:hypothetical protein